MQRWTKDVSCTIWGWSDGYFEINVQIRKASFPPPSLKDGSNIHFFAKNQYFKILSIISYYNLHFYYKKFNHGKIQILRRSYSDGQPLHSFLESKIAWFIDPMGGFYLNNIEERKEYIRMNNKMQALLWSIGNILKKSSF